MDKHRAKLIAGLGVGLVMVPPMGGCSAEVHEPWAGKNHYQQERQRAEPQSDELRRRVVTSQTDR